MPTMSAMAQTEGDIKSSLAVLEEVKAGLRGTEPHSFLSGPASEHVCSAQAHLALAVSSLKLALMAEARESARARTSEWT